MKTCAKCRESKPFDAFGKYRDGLRSRCRMCRAVDGADYAKRNPEKVKAGRDRYRAQNADAVKSQGREYRAKNRERENARVAAWQEKNKEAVRARAAAWYVQNRERAQERGRAYFAANRDAILAAERERSALPERRAVKREWENANRAKVRAIKAEYKARNPDRRRADGARRRAAEARALPSWADQEKIRAFYTSAEALNMLLGEWHHVDHIVPLRSRVVCGLHNEFNLQILPAAENISKSNRHWPDMWPCDSL